MGLPQVTYETTPSFSAATFFLYAIIFYAIAVIPLWVIFTKAGRPGWPALIPIYGTYVLLKIVGRSGWWLLWFLIPLVGLILYIIFLNDLSKSFGHGAGFTIGLLFLNVIFFYILAFGSSTYRGPAAAMGGAGVPPPSPPPPPMPVG